MWTPKRVLMLVGGMLAFLAGYGVYLIFFGGIDALPALPPDMEHGQGGEPLASAEPPNEREKMIQLAFGADSEELHRDIKLWMRDKGIVLSAGQFTIEDDGRVKFAPFSAALFPKNRDGGYPEINTVQCDFAYLTLDKPVQMPSELATRKVTAVELRGGTRGVTLINNRRTPEKKDDLEVHVSMSPLFYEERRNLIWTNGYVKLQDFQSQPKPTLITAKGMEMHLSPDRGPNKPKVATAPPRPKGDAVSNVDLLILRSNVNMHLYVEAGDGFLGASDSGQPTNRPDGESRPPAVRPGLVAFVDCGGIAVGAGCAAPAEKSHVFIKTNGPFTYDIPKELAWFDCPPVLAGGVLPAQPEQVLVSREHPEKRFDQLVCDHLKLQFRKKPTPVAAATQGSATTGNKEIETAVATTRPGQLVYLTMDTQNLEAYGNELHYHSATAKRGPNTLLKGMPLRAVKDGHKIRARELDLTGGDKDGNGKQAYGKGPGRIDLAGKPGDKQPFPVHIVWNDELISTRVREDDGKIYEKWTLTKDAAYVDDEQKQELRGQTIHLWLEPNDASNGGPKSSGGPKQKIHKIEAIGNVYALSQETLIKRADHLLINFLPEVAGGAELPVLPEPVAPTSKPGPTAPLSGLPQISEPVVAAAPAKGSPAVVGPAGPAAQTPAITIPVVQGTAPGAGPVEAPKTRKPVQLEADDVIIYVASLGQKQQLKSLDASRRVHVVQEAEKKGEKGLDITGDLLNLKHDPNGDILEVYGDSRTLARLEMNDTILFGPKVTIDQLRNHADVDGQGAMSMPSKTSLDGGKPARPGARMVIHWNKDMTFDGKVAYFNGGVLSEQDDSSLKCDSMQAVMDRMVVFKEGQKNGESAKVERLFCNRSVYILDEQLGPDGKRQQASTLECTQLDIDNIDGPTRASGPGRFRHLAWSDSNVGGPAPGSSPAAPGAPAPAPAKAPAQAAQANAAKVMKLTHITFKGWMHTNTKAKSKNAVFRDTVEVFNVPSEMFEINLDPDKLPPGGFHLKCETLDVKSRQEGDKTVQEMIARNRVYFRNPEMYGYCDRLSFDEASDLIVFDADPGNVVHLYKFGPGGKKSDDVSGEKIIYNRKTGAFRIGKNGVIRSSSLNRKPASRPNSIALARLDANGQDEALLRLCPAARNDRQKLAADGLIDNLALVGWEDDHGDLVVLVGAVPNRHTHGFFVDEWKARFLAGLEGFARHGLEPKAA